MALEWGGRCTKAEEGVGKKMLNWGGKKHDSIVTIKMHHLHFHPIPSSWQMNLCERERNGGWIEREHTWPTKKCTWITWEQLSVLDIEPWSLTMKSLWLQQTALMKKIKVCSKSVYEVQLIHCGSNAKVTMLMCHGTASVTQCFCVLVVFFD